LALVPLEDLVLPTQRGSQVYKSLYFPAAMSLIGDYHDSSTRSRAMSLHQSAVYAGSIAGGAVSGFVGQFYGWRSSFNLFGIIGIIGGLILWLFLREPARGIFENVPAFNDSTQDPIYPDSSAHIKSHSKNERTILVSLREMFANPMVLLLIVVFMGANFVAVISLTWMPTFLFQKFHMSLSMAGLSATIYLQIASVLGVITGGFPADGFSKKNHGGRLFVQALGLACGVPFLFLMGWTTSVLLLVLAMIGFGYSKGLYDANIFAGHL
jgi:sugar phosphate permease